jgi:hypothetical protein
MDLSDNRRVQKKNAPLPSLVGTYKLVVIKAEVQYEDPPQHLQGLKKQHMIRFRDGYEKVVYLFIVRMSCRSEVDEKFKQRVEGAHV